MKRILVVGEDALCCALGEKLVEEILPNWQLAQASVNCCGITRLIPRIEKYVNLAQHVNPVLCIADSDNQPVCELAQKWLRPHSISSDMGFLLRIAVSEAESWILADTAAFAEYFAVSVRKLPRMTSGNFDEVVDPKHIVLVLARQSKKRLIREEVVSPIDQDKRGSGYNTHLCAFVKERWSAVRASVLSASLNRALSRLSEFAKIHEN